MDGSVNGNASQDEAQAEWQKWYDGLSEEERQAYEALPKTYGDEANKELSNSLIETVNREISQQLKG